MLPLLPTHHILSTWHSIRCCNHCKKKTEEILNLIFAFYAYYSLGSISSAGVKIIKARNPESSEDPSDKSNNSIFGYNQIFILGIIWVGTPILIIKIKNKVKKNN